MTNRELKLKLNALRTLKSAAMPDASWISETRATLVAKVKNETVMPQQEQIVLRRTPFASFMFVLRPVVAGFMVIGIGIAGWAAGVSSSFRLSDKGSTPFKTAAEFTQLTFTADPAARAYLHLELAGRRANEVATLAESNSADRESDMKAAMDALQNEIVSVRQNLDEVSASKPQDSAAVAKAVDRKVAEISAVFGKTKNLLSKAGQEQADAVVAAADDVSIRAVAVLVAGAKTPEDKTDAATRVQDKIASAEKDMLVASTEAGEQAKAALEAAKAALAQDDLAQAITKVQEAADSGTAPKSDSEIEVKIEVNANENTNVNTNTGKIRAIDF
jgi:hypothetical protein